jgi:hypothetical protein
MNNQSVILSKDITTGDITPLVSTGNVLLTSRPSLNQLTNVEITTPTNGQYLQYDTSLTKWINKTPSYLSYCINAPQLNSVYTANTNFSIFASSSYLATPATVINYNFSNNITISSTTGLITGLSINKTYMVELCITKTTSTGSNGAHTLSLLDDIINSTYNVIVSNQSNSASGNASISAFTLILNTIITGQTKICPALRYTGATYTAFSPIINFNATVNVREL